MLRTPFFPIKSITHLLFSNFKCLYFNVVRPTELFSFSYFLLPILKPQVNIKVIIIAIALIFSSPLFKSAAIFFFNLVNILTDAAILLYFLAFCLAIKVGLYNTCLRFLESYPYAMIFLLLIMITFSYAGGIFNNLIFSISSSLVISFLFL